MTAIGPFADPTQIDFCRIGDGGLFLLEGPTGSGKSTVIDAISFALYGKVAQTSADAERLRSHHGDPATEPVVELVFETHNGLYRIRRTPAFERPKRSGTGTTKANSTVKLWRISSPDDLDGGEPLSTRIAEADDEITRAVGLTHAQFVQTVVLPQGEFANFLRSDTDSKKALLQKLFGTELLIRTQQSLVDGRRLAETRRSTAAKAINDAVHSFIGAAELDPGSATAMTAVADKGDDLGVAALVDRVLAELRAVQAETANANRAASAERAAAQLECQLAADVHNRRKRRDELRSQRQRLLSEQAQHKAARDELAAAEQAQTAVPAADALAAAIGRLNSAQKADADARDQLSTALSGADKALSGEGMTLSGAGEEQLRAACDERRTTLGQLAGEVQRERQLAELANAHTALQQQDEKLAASVLAFRTDLAALPARFSRLSKEREAAQAVAAQVPSVLAELERAQQRLVAAKRAVATAKLAAEDEQITSAALSALQDQQRRLGALRTIRVASIAGELGLALQAGDPCQVCGSVEHPQPAAPGDDHVTEDQVTSAETELARLHTAADLCRHQLMQQRVDLAELQVAADKLTPDLARAKLEDVTARVAAAHAAKAVQEQLADKLGTLEARIGQLSTDVQSAVIERASITERAAALGSRIAGDEALVCTARAAYASVEDRVIALSEEAQRLDHAARAIATLNSATTAAVECGATFQAALESAEFDTEASWQAARRDSSTIAILRSQIKTIDADWAAVQAGLAEPSLIDSALDGQPADLESLADRLRDAEVSTEAAAAAFGSARDRRSTATKHAVQLGTATGLGRQVLSDTAPAIRIGNLVAGIGENQLRMELTTYVLVRRFAEVVSAANTQLRRISSGRYQLEHSGARSGNARSGLGLQVLDLHTGKPRDPGTLSGGETFYVSLSLALGLADVVRSESGGVDLGTLFIDEGFGSLDPEVLDEVMAVLDSLRQGGRSVGLVSHVAELQARVADRIEVIRCPNGSSRLRVTG